MKDSYGKSRRITKWLVFPEVAFQEKTAFAGSGRLGKFGLTATQAILYFNALLPKQTVTLTFRFRAKYSISARTFQSRVYEHYDLGVTSSARPVQLKVRGSCPGYPSSSAAVGPAWKLSLDITNHSRHDPGNYFLGDSRCEHPRESSIPLSTS